MLRLVQALLVVVVAAATMLPDAATADGRDSFLGNRPGVGESAVFRDARGGAFRPRRLVLAGPGGALAAPLPENPRRTRSENRVNLSGVPLVGSLFRGTLDVATVRGFPSVGPVYRSGDALVVELAQGPADLAGRPVALTTNVPRYGAVSFTFGPLDWSPVASPLAAASAAPGAALGTALGTAHLVDGTLVLASRGGEPGWPSIESLFGDLF